MKFSLSNLLKVVKTSLLLVGHSKLTPSDVKMGVIIFKIMEKKRSSENLPLKKSLIMKCLSVNFWSDRLIFPEHKQDNELENSERVDSNLFPATRELHQGQTGLTKHQDFRVSVSAGQHPPQIPNCTFWIPLICSSSTSTAKSTWTSLRRRRNSTGSTGS